MDISLRPDLQSFLNDCIQSGRYRSMEEALTEAVQLLKQTDEAESRLETLLQEADDSPATEMTPQDWIDIENEGLKRLRTRKSA